MDINCGIENLHHLRWWYLNYHKQTVGSNIDIKVTSAEGSEGNEEHVVGNCMKKGSCYIVTESLARSYPTVI